MRAPIAPDRPVSIPERVWGGLERNVRESVLALIRSFQSLRGFGVGWSGFWTSAIANLLYVSIPERVWGGLELHLVGVNRHAIDVSIPERVWGGLELRWDIAAGDRRLVSIPERVWGGLELFLFHSPKELTNGFNP